MTQEGSEEAAYYRAIEDAMHSAVVEILREEMSPETLLKLADLAAESVDHYSGEMATHHPSPVAIQCAPGCPWCCYLIVETTPPEAYRIVRHLVESKSPEELAGVRSRVVVRGQRIRRMDGGQRAAARVPCPLLVDDRCSIHTHRPLKCRGGNSNDADLCRRNFERAEDTPLPVYLPQLYIADHIQRGLDSGLSAAGMVSRRLELIATLRILLEVPEALQRWLSGEDVFAPAVIPE